MKIINKLLFFVFVVVIFLTNGCSEESQSTMPASNTLPTTLNVYAGEDIQVILPSDSRFLILSGSYFATRIQGDVVNLNNVKIQWKKISGPSGYKLELPNSINTIVSNLEKGIYEFELTVTTENGLSVKDIVRYTVGSISDNPNEIIFENNKWFENWSFEIQIGNFILLVPYTNFKVYIKRENNPQWEEVKHSSENSTYTLKYDYFVQTRPGGCGCLIITHYATNPNDTPSIKIVY